MIKQVLIESLTNADKEYSSKKIMSFLAFNVAIVMAVLDQLTAYKVNMEVFNTLMLVATGQSVLSLIGNKILTGTTEKQQ